MLPLDGGAAASADVAAGACAAWSAGRRRATSSTRRNARSTLPNTQLVRVDPATGEQRRVPLAQASDGTYAPDGKRSTSRASPSRAATHDATRAARRRTCGDSPTATTEATPLTADYAGTSKNPMLWNGRDLLPQRSRRHDEPLVDAPAGGDLTQHTKHSDFDASALRSTRAGSPISSAPTFASTTSSGQRSRRADHARLGLRSDAREVDHQADGVGHRARISPIRRSRRLHRARQRLRRARRARAGSSRPRGTRQCGGANGRFMPDGKSLVALSDQSGEVEFWNLPASGIGDASQVTTDGGVAVGRTPVAGRQAARASRHGSPAVDSRHRGEDRRRRSAKTPTATSTI